MKYLGPTLILIGGLVIIGASYYQNKEPELIASTLYTSCHGVDLDINIQHEQPLTDVEVEEIIETACNAVEEALNFYGDQDER